MPDKAYLSLIVCLLSLSSASAQTDIDKSYPYYFGLGVGFSSADVDCDYYYYSDGDCDGEDTSFKIYGGKRLHENLGFEIAYQDLGKLDNEEGRVTTTGETTGLNFSLLGIIPFEGSGFLYGKAGFMAWKTDYTREEYGNKTTSDDSGTEFTFGLGYAFSFENKYEVRLEFERLNELDENFDSGGAYITNFTIAGNMNFE